jgi:serine/threonine protein kinase
MEFVHNREILHRDLRPEHILIDPDGDLKIGGFGSISDSSNDLSLIMGHGYIEHLRCLNMRMSRISNHPLLSMFIRLESCDMNW